jgi:hypothetical protein
MECRSVLAFLFAFGSGGATVAALAPQLRDVDDGCFPVLPGG